MWLKKMKKKKFQFLLVSMMLCFTSVIFTACISFVIETSAYTDDFISYQNCPRVLALESEAYDTDYFTSHSNLMEVTDHIAQGEVTLFDRNFWFGDKQLKTYLNLAYHVNTLDDFIHPLKLLAGNGTSPAYGEIWINSVTADIYDIKVGDTIHLGTKDGKAFRVGGIVATLICPSPYMGILPYYISEDTAELFDETLLTSYALFSNQEISVDVYKDFVPDDFFVDAVTSADADDIHTSISYLADIFGGVGILAAVIVFIVSLIIIRFIIISTLSKEYVEIGTYKALGFTENQITGFYLKSFVASGTIGILLGGALSFPITRYLCQMVLRHIGIFQITMLSVLTAICVFVLLTLLLTVGVLLSLKKTRKITPIEAFSINNTSSKKKIGRSLIQSAYSPLSVAINDIARKGRTSIITISILIVSFYMATLFLSVNYSLQRMGEMTGQWFTFPDYSAIIPTNGKNSELEQFLNDSDLIDYYLYSNADIDLSGIRSAYDINMKDVYAEIYSDCSEDALSLPLLKGRHPKADDEILMSYDLAKKTNLNVGDWFSIENDCYQNDYLITGLYSSMYNGGLNILIDGEEFAQFGKPDDYNSISLFAKEGVSYEQIEDVVKKAFPECNISQTEVFLEGSVNSLNNISKPLTTLFAIIFSLFSLLNIVNLLIMNNIENRRQYGVLKAMGFTNGYICLKNMLRIFILASLSAALSVLIHTTLSQKIFFGVIHVNGLIPNPQLTAAVTGVLFIIIIITTAMFTLPLRKIAPTDLMEE